MLQISLKALSSEFTVVECAQSNFISESFESKRNDFETKLGRFSPKIYRKRQCRSRTFFHKIEAKIKGVAYPRIQLCLEFSRT